MTLFRPTMSPFCFLTELLCHSFDKLQFPQCGDGPSSISPWDQRNSLSLSLPWGFLWEIFHNCSSSEHVQTQAAVRFMENRLDYSLPATTSISQGVSVRLSSYSPPVFFVFLGGGGDWHSRWSHGWLAWCVIVGLVIVSDLINHNEDQFCFPLYFLSRCFDIVIKELFWFGSPGTGGSGNGLWSCESCVRSSSRWCCSSSSRWPGRKETEGSTWCCLLTADLFGTFPATNHNVSKK